MHETIELLGTDGRTHTIDARDADLYRNGRDGTATTDEQYDETKARLAADNSQFLPEGLRP